MRKKILKVINIFDFKYDLVVTGHVKIGNCTDLYISAVLGVPKYLLCYRHHH